MAYFLKSLAKVPKLPFIWRRSYSSNPSIAYSEEVLTAKREDKPIVALESTIITHGMPYPQNLETAIQVENIIRDRGAVPATVAILQGQLTIGLSEQQLRYLSQAKGVVKASRRDLAPVAALRLDGATTVAGTLVAAALADLSVFVTGGIGGVHREGQSTLDVSADLTELGRTSTLVVCSGVKSILDIGRTLEYLETQGVCVCAFGETDDFPAFYTMRSGHKAPHRVADAAEAARLLHASLRMRLGSGIVVAVPVPSQHSMDEKIIDCAIAKALKQADVLGIRGKEVTPFILSAVGKATSGASLSANIALIKNNAKVGADIAVEFQKQKSSTLTALKGDKMSTRTDTFVRKLHVSCRRHNGSNLYGEVESTFGAHKRSDDDVLVIGGANVDRSYRLAEEQLQLDGSTHACSSRMCGGGVGRNMAEALWRLRDGRARLLTALGDDADGRYLQDIAPGLMLDGCVIPRASTATYAAVLDSRGECRLGLGDMAVHNYISPQLIDKHRAVLEKAPLVVVDGNVPQPTMDHIMRLCHQLNKPVFFEPTDRRKAIKLLHKKKRISFVSPNLAELRAMATFLNPNLHYVTGTEIEDLLKLTKEVANIVDFVVVTLGSKGVLTVTCVRNESSKDFYLRRLYPVELLNSVVNVSGAGDCFASGFIHGMLSGLKQSECVSLGFKTAKCALLSENTVPSKLNICDVREAYFEEIS